MDSKEKHDNITDIALLKAQDEHQFQLAEQTLHAQAQDRHDERLHIQELAKRHERNVLILGIIILVLFFGFGFYAMYLGKEAFLADVLKVIFGAFGGGGIGFAIGIRKKKEQ